MSTKIREGVKKRFKQHEELAGINNLNREFTAIQVKARTLLAKQRNVPLDTIDWPIGCVHDLRRTYGTWMARVLPIHELKVFMGHCDIATTVAFYLAVSESSADRVREALAETGST